MNNEDDEASWTFGYDVFEGPSDRLCPEIESRYMEELSLSEGSTTRACVTMESLAATVFVRVVDFEKDPGLFHIQVESGSCACFSGFAEPIYLETGSTWTTEDLEDEGSRVPDGFDLVAYNHFDDAEPTDRKLLDRDADRELRTLFDVSEALSFDVFCKKPPCQIIMTQTSGIYALTYYLFEGQDDEECSELEKIAWNWTFPNSYEYPNPTAVCVDVEVNDAIFFLVTENITVAAADPVGASVALEKGPCTCFSGYSDPLKLKEGDAETSFTPKDSMLIPHDLPNGDTLGLVYDLKCKSPPCHVIVQAVEKGEEWNSRDESTLEIDFRTGVSNPGQACEEYSYVDGAFGLPLTVWGYCILINETESTMFVYDNFDPEIPYEVNVDFGAGRCPCYHGYEPPIQLKDGDDYTMENFTLSDTFQPFEESASYAVSFEIFCQDPPCYASIDVPVGLVWTTVEVFGHDSSMPACEDYVNSDFGNDDLPLCLTLTESYTTILVAAGEFETHNNDLRVVVDADNCPSCFSLLNFDEEVIVPELVDGDQIWSTDQFEKDMVDLPSPSVFSFNTGLIFDVDCPFGECIIKFDTTTQDCFEYEIINRPVDILDCTDFQNEDYLENSGTLRPSFSPRGVYVNADTTLTVVVSYLGVYEEVGDGGSCNNEKQNKDVDFTLTVEEDPGGRLLRLKK